MNSVNSDQSANNQFKIDGIKYFLDEKDLANTRLQDTNTTTTGTNSLPHICNLDPEKIKWLQQQDEYITKLIDKCKSTENDKIPYHLDEHGITYRKIRDGPNIFHAMMVSNAFNHIFYIKAMMH